MKKRTKQASADEPARIVDEPIPDSPRVTAALCKFQRSKNDQQEGHSATDCRKCESQVCLEFQEDVLALLLKIRAEKIMRSAA